MPRLRPLAAALFAALALLVALAQPAAADEARSVQVIAQEGREVEFLVYLDPNAVVGEGADVSSTVVVSGAEVPSEATPVIETTAPKEAILVLDISGSMRGPRLAAAKEASIAYVNGLPDDVEIGLVTFNDEVQVVIEPTTDKRAVIEAIQGLEAGQKTALFEGMIAGLDLADADKGARLLVLSDGGDTVSAATEQDVLARAQQDGIPLDIVALTPTVSHAAVLRQLSSGTGGQFLLATDVTGLQQAFEEATGSFGGKVTVRATVPEEVDASGKFAIVTVDVDGTEFTGTSQLPKSDALVSTTGGTSTGGIVIGEGSGTETTNAPPPEPTSPWIYAILVALIVITIALALASYRRQQRSRLRVEQVLWYSTAVTTGVVPGVRPQSQPDSLFASLDQWLATKSWYPAMDTRLDNAGLSMTVTTWLFLRAVAMLVLALVLTLVIGNALIGIPAGLLIGWLITRMWLGSKEGAKRKEFEEELPDFLLLIASSLRSGLSFQQALDSTAAEGQGEVSRQMRRVISETQLGSTMEAALMRVSERMQSEDLKWTVTALAIQREVGGNLSNILDTAAQTVKGRAELRREVRTLSAEGRLSGWVLAALPVGLFVYMFFANRDYVAFFWTYTVGWAALGGLVVMFALGFFWVRRLVRIEV